MDYQTAVTTHFIPRCTAALNSIRDLLLAAGVPANRVVVEMVDSNDLRFRITATRGARIFIAYIELTSAGIANPNTPEAQAIAVLTFYAEGGGSEITHSYSAGVPLPYTTDAGIDSLLVKLTQVENTTTEVGVKARAYLGV